jgi:lysyl-tRNA synthetase class 1
MIKPPRESSVHIPYNLLIKLAKVAPKGSEKEFIKSKLKEYGYLEKTERELDNRILYTLSWVEDFSEETIFKVELTDAEAEILKLVIDEIHKGNSPEDYQNAVFNAANKKGIKPRDVFPIIYKVLLGKTQGPRLGPYISLLGKEKIVLDLENAIKKIV